MYPGPDDPDLGVFVANLERELASRGHELERAVVDTRSGGRRRHAALAWDAIRAARRFGPDVTYAHFLAPAGLAAALASRAPLVVTAHGQDVRNVGSVPGAVINCPNRLFMGEGRRDEIDEIRHEDDPATLYRIDD